MLSKIFYGTEWTTQGPIAIDYYCVGDDDDEHGIVVVVVSRILVGAVPD